MWALFSSLVFGGNIFAADTTADFSAANELYAKGKFAEAAGAYEKILQSGVVSPALWFNYGNAEFKCGELGLAIAAYRHAALLSPRDAEVRANLGFVRSQVPNPVWRENRWQNWMGGLTLNEWTWLAALAFWGAFVLLAALQIRPVLAARLRGLTRIFVALTIFSGACLGLQAASHFSKSTAVVILPEAMARSGPFDDAQNVFSVHDGAELPVLDRRNGWLQVADGLGKSGWLNEKQVKVLPDA
jgi:tetratricopeptide (TPR) repeat protein